MQKILVCTFLIFSLFLAESSLDKISKLVQNDVKDFNVADVLIIMKEQADFNSLNLNKMDHVRRGRFLVSHLIESAERSQHEVLKILKAKNVWFKPYWITNVIAVEAANPDLLNLLSERDDIKEIRSDRIFHVDLEKEDAVSVETKDSVQWNIQFVKAPEVWAKGFKGKGFTVASADTGVEWTHEAIQKNYRGFDGKAANHNYNWWDGVKKPIVGGSSCGYNTSAPCDDNSHGTHTVGTMLGTKPDGNILGMAPEAKFVACRNMDRGYGRPHTYIECLQFFLAPTDLAGRNPNPDKRPHAIGNSYGCPRDELCEPNSLKEACDALRAGGVFMSVANGNSGPSCKTTYDPPGLYGSVISIGATGYNTESIASFSSRGPVTADGSNRRKPDLTAPGSAVYSCVKGNRYSSYSGTSMATPHVAGAVALLWQAKPELLRDIDATQKHFEKTANHKSNTDCSSEGVPNNVYGYGMINMQRAISE